MEKFAQKFLIEAEKLGAQDLYVLPRGDNYQLLARNGETRHKLALLPTEKATQLMAHFKFIAGMNVGEKRRPQLGSCLYDIGGRMQRLRLSSAGDFENRESMVIRFLYDGEKPLGFWIDGENEAKRLIQARGLYLFSGPVGSGKTTLMHYLATHCFTNSQIISIEDPVEIVNPDFLQLQLNETIGMTYDTLIKLSLRHMPDLVMVGEIRDEETARAVIRASLTGYTVFSTVHAKSPKGVVARLIELGITQGELANALSGIVYQRLLNQKGLLEVVNENFADWTPNSWNAKLQRLVTDGSLDARQARAEEIKA
ncbi:MAG: Flp pilus assembly complex ATPase component TadA [Streptococcaceae bacterium]|nr:Flp pilus assembly complex ATPase component TadA [Streptococcaceae bacterium]